MNKTFVLFQKDFKQLLFSFTGFISLILFPLLLSIWIIFVVHFFDQTDADFTLYFSMYPTIMILLIPIISIKLSIDDHRWKTDGLMKTLPFSEGSIIIARFIAIFAIFILMYTGSLVFPFSLMSHGNFDTGKILTNIIGLLFLGSASISLCILVSTIVPGSMLSWIISTITLILLGTTFLSGGILSPFTFSSHMESFSRGILCVGDMLYFILIVFFSLYISIKVIFLRRWS
ncbi:MAG: ABC-2 transporter permease [Spirochaetaceae bacterium]|jgi:ABC-2 type transport system permease protein|nr:ABC-2 transporter permease [Spirochaetaceae bacterium]